MEYKIDRVIYGDGREVYEVYYMAPTLFSHGEDYRKVSVRNWIDLSLAKTHRSALQKEHLDSQVILRKEVL